MSKKTFSWHFQNSEFFEQHFVTREYLHKSFIRDTLTENKNIKIVDNWSSVNDFFFKNQKSKVIKTFKKISKWKKKLTGSRIEKSRKLKTGNLIHLNYPILRHKFWDKIQLQVPMMPNARPVNLIRLVKTLRKSAVNNTNKKKLLPVQLLKPTKGGFIVRFSTIKGFLPTSQFKKAKKALKEKCQKVNPLDNLLSMKEFNLDNKKFAHIFAYFKNPKIYLECRDEKVLSHLNTLKSNGNNTNLIEKYHFLKENTEYFKNFEIKKLSSKKKYTLRNFSKIKLPLQYNHTRFTYKNKEPIFVKKRKLGKRRFFRRNFNLTAKKTKYFHKLHSTIFFYDKYKHSSFIFKPKFKKHFKFKKNWKFNKNNKFNNNFKKFPNKDNKFGNKFQDKNKFQNKENRKFQYNNKFKKNFENTNINSQNSNNTFKNNNNLQKKNFLKNNDNKFQNKDNNKTNKKFENNNKNFKKDSKFTAKNKNKNDL